MVKKPKTRKKSKKTETPDTISIPLLVQTNEPSLSKEYILKNFYKAAQHYQIGYMDGMDPDTGDIVPLLILLDMSENGTLVDLHAIARIFDSPKDFKNYLVPDGKGNYVSLDSDDGDTAEEEEGSSLERISAPDGESIH